MFNGFDGERYYTGGGRGRGIDGVMGNGTHGAVMAFQMDSGPPGEREDGYAALNALGVAIP